MNKLARKHKKTYENSVSKRWFLRRSSLHDRGTARREAGRVCSFVRPRRQPPRTHPLARADDANQSPFEFISGVKARWRQRPRFVGSAEYCVARSTPSSPPNLVLGRIFPSVGCMLLVAGSSAALFVRSSESGAVFGSDACYDRGAPLPKTGLEKIETAPGWTIPWPTT